MGFKGEDLSNFWYVDITFANPYLLLVFQDRHYVTRQLRIFQKMVEKGLFFCLPFPFHLISYPFLMDVIGLIYRQHKPVYYSPSSRSALAEAELEYTERHISHPVYVLFDIDKNSTIENKFLHNIVSTQEKVQLAVWTTTPWTLSANMVRVSDCLVGSPANMLCFMRL